MKFLFHLELKKETSSVKQRNTAPSQSGGGIPIAAPACVSGLEMPLVLRGQQERMQSSGPLFVLGKPRRGWGRARYVTVPAQRDTWGFTACGAAAVNRPDTGPDSDTSVATATE